MDAFSPDDDETPAEPDTSGEAPIPADICGAPLDCGGECCLAPDHAPPCRCIGDDGDGCPA